jgi:hypothetical protein
LPAQGGCLVANSSGRMVGARGMYVLDVSAAVGYSAALASCAAQGGALPMFRTQQQQVSAPGRPCCGELPPAGPGPRC